MSFFKDRSFFLRENHFDFCRKCDCVQWCMLHVTFFFFLVIIPICYVQLGKNPRPIPKNLTVTFLQKFIYGWKRSGNGLFDLHEKSLWHVRPHEKYRGKFVELFFRLSRQYAEVWLYLYNMVLIKKILEINFTKNFMKLISRNFNPTFDIPVHH